VTIPGYDEWVAAAVPRQARVVRLGPADTALPREQAGTDRTGTDRTGTDRTGTDRPDTVVLDRVLPRLDRPDALLAEVRDILRPAGSLVVVVAAPSRLPWRRGEWACRTAVDHPGWLLAAADFALLGDDRAVFDAPAELPEDLREAGVEPRRRRLAFRRLVARR
jgi:SAM-dependent methyltransferase